MCLLYEIELENLTEDECFGDECGFEDFFLPFFNLLELLERPADEESFKSFESVLYNLPFLALLKDFPYRFFTVLDSNVSLHLPFQELYLSTNFDNFKK